MKLLVAILFSLCPLLMNSAGISLEMKINFILPFKVIKRKKGKILSWKTPATHRHILEIKECEGFHSALCVAMRSETRKWFHCEHKGEDIHLK